MPSVWSTSAGGALRGTIAWVSCQAGSGSCSRWVGAVPVDGPPVSDTVSCAGCGAGACSAATAAAARAAAAAGSTSGPFGPPTGAPEDPGPVAGQSGTSGVAAGCTPVGVAVGAAVRTAGWLARVAGASSSRRRST
ncbi:Hypothetical protein KLENKIAIHU_905 [Klenkia terrae]|nr:Hypothetical protein KLENKIAIHU_905 [Klenkia terrae]